MHFYPQKQQFLLLSDSFIKRPQQTELWSRRILVCFGLPLPYFRITVNIMPVITAQQSRQPLLISRNSCALPQHSSPLPQCAGPCAQLCLARPLAKLWESKYRWTCADKITNYRNGRPNGCNKFQCETNSLRFYWLLMLLLPALVLLFDSSHILLFPKGLFGPSALINMLPWEGACFK